MYSWDSLRKANESIKTTDIKGKDYAEVNQRIKAFRMVCPGGGIHTDMLSNENGVCIFRATVLDEEQNILGIGTAYEKESSSYINKTSYIENCETSAVGRALGMCGFGIDTSVASFEEVTNAINNQESAKEKKGARKSEKKQEKNPEITAKMIGQLLTLAAEVRVDPKSMMGAYRVDNLYNLSMAQYDNAIKTLNAKKGKKSAPESPLLADETSPFLNENYAKLEISLSDILDSEGVPQ